MVREGPPAAAADGTAVAATEDASHAAPQSARTTALSPAVQRVLDGLPSAVALQHRDGRVVFVSARFIELFGYTLTDIPHLDDWWPRAYPDPEYRREVTRSWQEEVAAAIETGRHVEPIEHDVTCKGGTIRRIEFRLAAIEGDLALVLFNDVTTTRETERALLDEVSFSKAIIENAADGICVCHRVDAEPHVHFTVWNRRMEEITGYTIEQINERGWYQTMYPDAEVREAAIARMDRIREGDNLNGEEWPIARADGTTIPLGISTSVVRTRDGSAHVLGIMQDLSARRRAEAERLEFETRVQQAQKLESLGVLAGGVAHDFNNLLVAVLGNADLALDDLPRDSPVRENLEEIRAAATRAAELTQQMLAYAGRNRIALRPVNLNDVLTELKPLIQSCVSSKTALVVRMTDQLPLILADVAQLRQVIMNLVTNAAEALPDHRGSVAVETRVERVDSGALLEPETKEPLPEGTYVSLRVRDTGVGMSSADRDRAFEPFFTTKFSGRGLGLPAVIGIVRRHNGSVRVETAVGRGSCFEVLIPTAVASDDATRTTEHWCGKGLVLVADDEEWVRKTTKRMLERLGFDVIEAVDGEDALMRASAHQSELRAVLLDITMPRMDGPQALRELRQRTPELPILMMSGFTEDDVKSQGVGSASAFLQKPFKIETLRTVLRGLLESE